MKDFLGSMCHYLSLVVAVVVAALAKEPTASSLASAGLFSLEVAWVLLVAPTVVVEDL